MGRINTNINSLYAINSLQQNQADLSLHLERLSTGLKINSGADAPAGLIASQQLQSEMAGISQAVDNSQQAGNVVNTADGALSEVSSMLLQMQSLTNQAANTGALSPAEISANQLQVDSILASINRISNTTEFNGVQLLNGQLDFTTSGVATSAITGTQLNAVQVPTGSPVNVTVQVVTSARLADVNYAASGIGASATTIEVAGNLGTEQLSFAASTHNSAIAFAINGVKGSTGVSATVETNGQLQINSTEYGSAQFVSVKTIGTSGAFVNSKQVGRDAVVTINGTQADVNGLDASVRTGNFDVDLTLKNSFATKQGATSNFYVTGGGAKFQLGSEVNQQGQVQIGIASVSTDSLGSNVDGFLSALGSGGSASLSSGNLIVSQRILNDAISQVSTLRGRLGAFQADVIDSNVNSLNVALENVTASESDITDADFATETAALTRAQILVQANTSVLAQANSSPQSVLTLLQNA
jgi:flagellin